MLTCRNIFLEDDLDWKELIESSQTASFFQTRDWLSLWVKNFSSKDEVRILGIYEDKELIGIAPLYLKNRTINFLGLGEVLGGELVSDFGDIIAKISYEKVIWKEILAELRTKNQELRTSKIEFNFVREDSLSYKILQELGGKAEEVDAAPYTDLPAIWDEYLGRLDRHDRHELKRKMRKLEGEGAFTTCPDPQDDNIEEFFRLMQLSSDQKRSFLSEEMRSFFRGIFATFTPKKMLQLCFLKLKDKIIAATLSFIFKDEVLLYNSGYDPGYSNLSPGLLLKAHVIKQAIEEGKKRFDFLRGGERYKFDLGATNRRLYKFIFD